MAVAQHFSFQDLSFTTPVISTPLIEIDQAITISFSAQGVDQLLGRSSPTAKYLETVATLVMERASQLVGKRYSGHHAGPRLADSGRIVHGTGDVGEDIGSVSVVFQNPHAFLHHQGTRGHFIGDGQLLVNKHNPARTEGGQFFARGTVQHQGSDGNPFLVNAARELGLPVQRPSMRTGAESTVPVPKFVPSS